MKTYIFFALIFASISHAQDPFSYELSLKPNGHFTLKFVQQYPPHIPLEEILHDVFLDEYHQKLVNSELNSQKHTLKLSELTNKLGTTNYTMTTKMTNSGVTATINSKCQVNVTANSINNNCQITSSNAFLVGSVFNYGNSDVTCTKQTQYNLCQVVIKGQPKGVDMLLVSRTADRLAISGTAKTIREFHQLFKYKIDHRFPTSSDTFIQKNIQGLWDKLMAKLDKNEKLSKAVTIKSSRNGFVISN